MTKALVLIPAFGCDQRLYGAQIAAFNRDWEIRVIIPGADTFEAMVMEVLSQAPHRFAILGTSMGGRLALEVALAAPTRVTGLCVIGAAAGAVADRTAGLRRSRRIRSGEKDKVVEEMAQLIAHLPGPRGAATRDAFIAMGKDFTEEHLARQSDALAHRDDKWSRLGEVSCPTLCLWGEHDQFSPTADGRLLAQGIPHGHYVELANCGHFPTLEYPEQSTVVIGDWLQRVGTGFSPR